MTRNQCLSILELRPDATADQITKAYRQLALVWHPDRFSNNPELQQKANAKLAEINEAYKILGQLQTLPDSSRTKIGRRERHIHLPIDESVTAPKENISLGTWVLLLLFLSLGAYAIYDQMFSHDSPIVTPPPYAETKGNFTVWTEPQFPQSGEPFRIGVSVYIPGKGPVYKTDDFIGKFLGPTRSDVIIANTDAIPTHAGIASFLCQVTGSDPAEGEEFEVASKTLGQHQRFTVGMKSEVSSVASLRHQKAPEYAIQRGDFSAWMDPREPMPGQDYDLVIQLKLPPGVTTYSGSDLKATITGPNNFLRDITYQPHQFLPIEHGTVQIRIDVPNAAHIIRHSIYVESKLLNEEAEFEIEFP